MNWRERIVSNEKVLCGKPVVKGTRMAVEFVVGLLGNGWTVDDVLREYDHLMREDIAACCGYAAYVLQGEKIYPMPTTKAG